MPSDERADEAFARRLVFDLRKHKIRAWLDMYDNVDFIKTPHVAALTRLIANLRLHVK